MSLLTGMLTLAFNIQPVKASGTIYIRADGSIDPPTAPILTVDNVTYTFTGGICADSIVIEKDDIVIDGNGHVLNGSVSGFYGFDISYRNNVTIKNTEITKFGDGIYVYHSNSCRILSNIVADCWYAIDVMHFSNNNTVSGNFVDNCYGGISIDYSSNDNTVTNNTVTNSRDYGWGLYLWSSSGNVFSDNIAINNSKGMDIRNAVNNTIHYNNISGNQRGIYLSSSSNNIISQNNITANMEVGVFVLTHSSDNIISGNTITNNTFQGIELYEDSLNNSIVGNAMINNQYGIWIHHYSDYNIISKNTITNNEYGIMLSESTNSNTISGNNVTANNWHGISLYSFSNNNSFSGNNITNNGYGIVIYGSSNNSIFKNRITANNNVGYLQYSSDNRISGNNITDNANGMRLEHSSNNHIYHNNLINNTDQAYTYESLNTWDYGYPSGGNYWSDYAGVDADGDGIGDTPYIIDADNQDRYPLMHPWSSLPVHNINTGLGYATIQEAINAPETLDGHTIFVGAGTYYEHIVVNKTLSIVGEIRDNTFIDASGTGTAFTVTQNDVTITGFTIQNSGVDWPNAAVLLNGSRRNVIRNNIIRYTQRGIGLRYGTSGNIISENNITSRGIAVFYGESGYAYETNLIMNNIIRSEDGIALCGTYYNNITGNILIGTDFSGGGYYENGIKIFGGGSNIIVGNIISHVGWEKGGIALWSDNDTVSNNLVEYYPEIGIGIFGSGSLIIGNNLTKPSKTGWERAIHLVKPHNTVVGNIIANHAYAIGVSSSGNYIYHNNFVNNTNPLYQFGSYNNTWDNGYPSGGNYWGDYVGVDVCNGPNQDLPGSDCIGDVAYVIDEDNQDRYPLMNPYGTPPPQTYNLTITTTVGGTTDPAPGTYSYTVNSSVQVTAIPEAGYLFDHWELDSVNAGSANPYTVLMDQNHTFKAVFAAIPPPLSASISPLSASILVGQSVTFISTVSGGYTPYSYQWYLNGNPVSGATSASWTFTSTEAGIYYVCLKVTDAKGNTAQSETARITAAAVPVGGYSIPINGYTGGKPLTPYLALLIILASLTMVRRKIRRRTKRPQCSEFSLARVEDCYTLTTEKRGFCG